MAIRKKRQTAEDVLRRQVREFGNHWQLSIATGIPAPTINRFANEVRGMTLKKAQPLLDYFDLELRPRKG